MLRLAAADAALERLYSDAMRHLDSIRDFEDFRARLRREAKGSPSQKAVPPRQDRGEGTNESVTVVGQGEGGEDCLPRRGR